MKSTRLVVLIIHVLPEIFITVNVCNYNQNNVLMGLIVFVQMDVIENFCNVAVLVVLL